MSEQDDEATDAIRYALLCRLAPGIRHGLISELQAIEYLAELAARQLQTSADPTQAQDGLSHIIAKTRKTVGSCSSLVEWLRPEAGASIALGEGITQCLKLAGDDWPLRGIEATTNLQTPDALIDKTALRELCTASHIALIDMHPGALDIEVQNAAESEHIELRFGARTADRRRSMSSQDRERRFTWADVQLLAKAHGVPCSCQAHGATLRLRQIVAPVA